MPIINPKVAGDIWYPQYLVKTEVPIGNGVNVEKGKLYTRNAAGYLVPPTAAGTNYFVRGLFQASRDVPAALNTDDGVNMVDVFGVGSRIGIPAGAAMPEGAKVKYNIATGKVELLSYSAPPLANELFNAIGYVYEVYTKVDIETQKIAAVADDVVVVELRS